MCHLDRNELWMMRVTNIKIDNLASEITKLNNSFNIVNSRVNTLYTDLQNISLNYSRIERDILFLTNRLKKIL